MTNAQPEASPSLDLESMRKLATAVLHHIEQQDVDAAMAVLNDLAEVRDQHLYQEVGRLTRALHDSIRNLDIKQSTDDRPSDALNQLNYVVEMTDKSANKTMDLVELGTPVAHELNQHATELMDKWQRFKNKEMSLDEFKSMSQELDQFLELSVNHSGSLKQYFSDILLAQDYQDLTGQVIHTVADLITRVESQLVQLVSMAGHVDQAAGIQNNDEPEEIQKPETASGLDEKAEGPNINKSATNVVHSQDDVDDLLSSLGF